MHDADLQRQIAALDHEIAEITAERDAAKRASVRQALDQELAEKGHQRATLLEQAASGSTFGDQAMIAGGAVSQGNPAIHGGTVHGGVVGTNLGTIIYGADLNAPRREQLVRYLQRVINRKEVLQLHGIAGTLDKGLNLPDVYVMLATDRTTLVAQGGMADLALYLEDGQRAPKEMQLNAAYNPDVALPAQALFITPIATDDHAGTLRYAVSRAVLVAEAVLHNQHLVLCAAPGSGKSTFLHYLAWVLAQRGLDQIDAHTFLHGWNDEGQRRLLPVMISLRTLAGAIMRDGASAATVSAALRHEMTKIYDLRQPDELLDHALATGTALLLMGWTRCRWRRPGPAPTGRRRCRRCAILPSSTAGRGSW